jgi:hypothetical protein
MLSILRPNSKLIFFLTHSLSDPISSSEVERRDQEREARESAKGGDSPLQAASRSGDYTGVESIIEGLSDEELNERNG